MDFSVRFIAQLGNASYVLQVERVGNSRERTLVLQWQCPREKEPDIQFAVAGALTHMDEQH